MKSGESRETYAELFDFAPDGYFALQPDAVIVETNLAGTTLLGKDREQVLNARFTDFVDAGDADQFRQFLKGIFSSPTKASCRIRLQRHDGKTATVDVHASARGLGTETSLCHALVSDITTEFESQRRRQLLLELLQEINRAGSRREFIAGITRIIADWMQCEAIGIRLRQGDDFPYYETKGFPRTFVEAESRLCAVAPNGEVIRDSLGNPVMECMCGNILCGRFDPALPFFSEGGSFWSNCTTDLLASTSEEDRQARTRNRCNGEGYESVALIPLQHEGTTFGLLQINDHQKNLFTEDVIRFLEMIGSYVAIALSHRLTETELVDSREQFTRIVETAFEGIITLDLARIVTYVNPQMLAMLGRRAEEMLGRPVIEFIYKDDLAQFEREMAVRRGGGSSRYEQRFIHANGSTIYFQISATPVKDDRGNVIGSFAMFTDVTARKRVEVELESSEERFRSMFDLHSAAMLLIEPVSGSIVDANPAAAKFYGYSRELLCSMNISEINQLPVEEVSKNRLSVLEREHNYFVFPHRLATGDVRTVEVYSTPMEIHGTRLLFSIIHDITERKRAEDNLRQTNEYLELAQRAAGAGLWDWDVATGELRWSPELYEMFGLDQRTTEASFEIWRSVIHPEDVERAEKKIYMAMENQQPLENIYRVMARDGTIRWIDARGKGQYDAQGKAVRMSGICLDITKRKKAEVELAWYSRLLESIRKAQGLFISSGDARVVFQELLNTLVELTGSAHGFLDEVVEDENGDYLIRSLSVSGTSSKGEPPNTSGPLLERSTEFRPLDNLTEAPVLGGRPVISNRSIREERSGGSSEGELPVDSRMSLPLYDGGKIVGVASVANRAGGYDDELAANLEPFCNTCAGMIRAERMRQRERETLRAVEDLGRKLTAIGNAAQMPIVVLDCEGRILMLNDSCAHSLGETRQNLVGRCVWDFFPKPRSDYRRARMQEVVNSGEFVIFEDSRNGSHFENSMYPIKDEQGRVTGVALFVHDITDRRKGEEELRQSEQTYRSLFENTLNGLARCQIHLDDNGRPCDWSYLSVNDAFKKLTGLENILGKRVSEAIPGIRESNPELFEIYGRVAVTGKPESFEMYVAPLERWFSVSAYCPESGQFVAVFDVITARKVAEQALRESEARFRSMFESHSAVMLVIDPVTMQIADANPAAVAFYGYPRTNLLSKRITEINEIPREEALAAAADTLSLSQNTYLRHHRLSSGEIKTLLVHSAPFSDGDQQLVLSVVHDITDREKSKNELQEANLQLEQERAALRNKNAALKEVLDHIESEKGRVKEQMNANTEVVIAPLLANLKGRIDKELHGHIDMIQKALGDISSPFANDLSRRFATLSPREVQVCAMIKNGSLSKEIADFLGVSIQTVHKFRQRIRQKLGITNDDADLGQILRQL